MKKNHIKRLISLCLILILIFSNDSLLSIASEISQEEITESISEETAAIVQVEPETMEEQVTEVVVPEITETNTEQVEVPGRTPRVGGYEQTIPIPTDIPAYYHTTVVGGITIYRFTGRDNNLYYRIYGTIDGENEGFYVTDMFGVLSYNNKD